MKKPDKALSDTAIQILDVAERMARQGGYNAFSFRDIAREIGIKSASIHYHFPTKEDLGEALVERYTNRFLDALGAADDAEPIEMLSRYVSIYRAALIEQQLMCLCGMFGAEIAKLPAPVSERTRAFFERNLEWLDTVFNAAGVQDPRKRSGEVIARLEGAMILARAMNDMDLFQRVTGDLPAESLRS
ncbi:TetR/AcrR family transcriptional regulator [Roseibium sp. RKSG952]|uniref:TetR/AcrR family transcriptional regulator n=1 Tax=Roseibium sp. RKSG952 TaxID=2529384 RepID=UPI0012BB905C|nr:TetR/AcrR family transcriptional regulator [Roseibium sp. RKSG952]MTI01268.1 TetR/AcrR family transcriptional regulator [Roseibium sp. RKSG952]